MKRAFFYIETDKSKGWFYSESLATLAMTAENCGHTIKEIRDISDEPNDKFPVQFTF